ncbi:CD63 antigen-like [Saccoglossus kowalevskii]|uniref:Tetraspanin n=1 Tax=Saccoglossus kowalevskii TaxID=10224 RepID=A0ABM0GT92_SACKO|nr:PREDICTED: CD63 antigen-like [Saccoglossus kowalevskii]
MVEGGMKIVKYLVFFFNFLFWVCGLALIVVGALAQVKYSEYTDITGGLFAGLPIYLIIIGCIISVVGFLGCCGAIKENYCMITTFAVILIIILILEIAAVIAGYILQDEIYDAVNEGLTDSMDDYVDENPAAVEAYDNLQEEFKCCGANNYTDWESAYNETNVVPDSCCKNITAGCGTDYTLSEIWQDGCTEKLEDALIDNFEKIAGVAIAIAVVELLGIICACCLMRSIKSEYEVV